MFGCFLSRDAKTEMLMWQNIKRFYFERWCCDIWVWVFWVLRMLNSHKSSGWNWVNINQRQLAGCITNVTFIHPSLWCQITAEWTTRGRITSLSDVVVCSKIVLLIYIDLFANLRQYVRCHTVAISLPFNKFISMRKLIWISGYY